MTPKPCPDCGGEVRYYPIRYETVTVYVLWCRDEIFCGWRTACQSASTEPTQT